MATETAIRTAKPQTRIGTLRDGLGCAGMTLAEFMLHQLLNDDQGRRTLAPHLRFGDEAGGCLQDFTRSSSVAAAQVTGIGRLGDVVLSRLGQLQAGIRLQRDGSGFAVHLKDAHVRPPPLGGVTGAPPKQKRSGIKLALIGPRK